MTSRGPARVLFVCLGNICRSPTAEGVFRKLAQDAGLAALADSAGTGAWHSGSPPDPRSCSVAAARGYDISGCRARQVLREDFARFGLIVAMDRSNLAVLNRMRPADSAAELCLMLEFSGKRRSDVPDPYLEGGFERSFDLIEAACRGLVKDLSPGGAT